MFLPLIEALLMSHMQTFGEVTTRNPGSADLASCEVTTILGGGRAMSISDEYGFRIELRIGLNRP